MDQELQHPLGECNGARSTSRNAGENASSKLPRVTTHAHSLADGSVISTDLPLPNRRQGKVRDLYELPHTPGEPDRVLVVASDRVSAFDVVMPTPIPQKGALLTRISLEWFRFIRSQHIVEDHLLGADPAMVPGLSDADRTMLVGRSMICRKVDIVPIECVVRGWLAGSGWQEYREHGAVCGVKLPAGLQKFGRLPEPIFTPAFKNAVGHDENCTFAQAAERVGFDLMDRLQAFSLAIYNAAAERSLQRGLVLADTKFEFGFALDASGAPTDRLLLADEVLTPDSSRYWPADEYEPGRDQPSFDKQYLRNWLLAECAAGRWDKQAPGPQVPVEVIASTIARYREAARRLGLG
jgi:phosphoribosylaminoimidazole-succinocarboxamide synthase